jgi:hypothetical protein
MKGLSGKEWVLLSEIIKPEEDVVSELGEVVAQILANRGRISPSWTFGSRDSFHLTTYQT